MTSLTDLAIEHHHTVALSKVFQVIEFLATNPIPQQAMRLAGQSTHIGEDNIS